MRGYFADIVAGTGYRTDQLGERPHAEGLRQGH